MASRFVALASIAMACAAGSAQANVAISTAPTSNMSCSAGVCTATAKNAVLNVGDLQAMLASFDASVRTGSATSNITVAAPFSWASGSSLTLDAKRSVIINKPITNSGTGGVALTTNDGATGGSLTFGPAGRIAFWSAANPLTINGASYTLVSSIPDLASGIAASPSGNYALSNNYNAQPDGIYHASPIATTLAGNVEGLGNTISNLRINGTPSGVDVGLFIHVASGASIRDMRLTTVAISGGGNKSIGGLVAVNDGALSGDTVSGSVTGGAKVYEGLLAGKSSGSVSLSQTSGAVKNASTNGHGGTDGGLIGQDTGTVDASSSSAMLTERTGSSGSFGGLIGIQSGGMITNSNASGAVTNPGGYAGGLVGYLAGAQAVDSFATGAVSAGNYGAGGLVAVLGYRSAVIRGHATGAISGGGGGGLVSLSDGLVQDSYATGVVSVSGTGGGLIAGGGTVMRSHATGNVTAGGYAGGLVGYGGQVSDSFATGTVNGSYAGGLIGFEGGASTSFATGKVNGSVYAGGLMGWNSIAANCYSTGDVQGGTVGGLVGENNEGQLQNSYEIGAVASSGTFKGGLVGYNHTRLGYNANAYWDTTTSGMTQGIGRGLKDDPGVVGISSAELQAGLPSGFDSSIWGQSPSINNGYPYLIANPPPQ